MNNIVFPNTKKDMPLPRDLLFIFLLYVKPIASVRRTDKTEANTRQLGHYSGDS